MTVAEVRLWDRKIGAVSWDSEKELGFFEYDPNFIKSGIQVAPLMMPLSDEIYSFPAIPRVTFRGLPGMLADSLPDDFGNLVINQALEKQGRDLKDFNPVERLCYTGIRGMGALEFKPNRGPEQGKTHNLEVETLVALASELLAKRNDFQTSFSDSHKEQAMKDILRVGTSAGGARAKAIVAWNPDTNEVCAGSVAYKNGFSYWILKFDGVKGNKDKELEDPEGYGLIEFAYSKMARQAGIQMAECRLFHEGGRSHFVTKRFDRDEVGRKIHMQSLGALAHYDYKQPGAYSYEQALLVMRKLGLSMESLEEQYRRAVFNIIARNQDDHVKNIAFLMNKRGAWSLSPAFDVNYSYNPSGEWTNSHQMSLNGKRDGFVRDDFKEFAKNASLHKKRAEEIFAEVQGAVRKWKKYADEAGVPKAVAERIANTHRVKI